MEILMFIFNNFWHFMGVCLLITIVGIIIREIVLLIVKASIARSIMKYGNRQNISESIEKGAEHE